MESPTSPQLSVTLTPQEGNLCGTGENLGSLWAVAWEGEWPGVTMCKTASSIGPLSLRRTGDMVWNLFSLLSLDFCY